MWTLPGRGSVLNLRDCVSSVLGPLGGAGADRKRVANAGRARLGDACERSSAIPSLYWPGTLRG